MKTINRIRQVLLEVKEDISTFEIASKLDLGINQVTGSISILKKHKEVNTFKRGKGKAKITIVIPTLNLQSKDAGERKIRNYIEHYSNKSKELKIQMQNLEEKGGFVYLEAKADYAISRFEDMSQGNNY